jgi:hypothetical protein
MATWTTPQIRSTEFTAMLIITCSCECKGGAGAGSGV